MGRILGVSYRVKKTAKNDPRPTLVAVKIGTKVVEYKLNNEDDEVDFARKQFPISWRKVMMGEDILAFKQHHCKWRKVKDDEDVSVLTEAHLRRVSTERGGEQVEICTDVPIAFDGLSQDDQVAMVLGAGNMLAGLLFIQGKRVGAKVYRTPPKFLDDNRPDPDKDQDHVNLLCLLEQRPHLFYEVRQPDKELINVAVKLDLRQQAQRARIAYSNQMLQSTIGQTYLDEEQEMEGLIKDRCQALMLSDVVYNSLLEEEAKREKELAKAVKATAVWPIFNGILGVGPRIAAGIMAPIGDIRRFEAETLEKGAAKLMKYCGVHVMTDGSFPRHRKGQVGGWSPEARQALFLLADQFNRQKDKSHWGKKLLQYKASFRQKHPEPVEVESTANGNGKKKKVKRYTDGHILKMAKWRVLTRFVRWLYKAWARIEN